MKKINKIREELNDKVRGWGNEHVSLPKFPVNGIDGLGDLLTTDINFRKAGATAGALLPLVAWYHICSQVFPESNEIVKMALGPILYGMSYEASIPLSTIFGWAGYNVGKGLDNIRNYEDI